MRWMGHEEWQCLQNFGSKILTGRDLEIPYIVGKIILWRFRVSAAVNNHGLWI
jgi:hypothetical protein